MKKIIAAALLASAFATPAFAEGNSTYLLAEYGSATYTNMSPFKDPGKLGLGFGYMFSNTAGIELGYTMFGDSTIVGNGQATLAASSFHPALVATLPVTPQFDFLGKIGLAMNKADLTSTVGITAATSKTSLYFAAGAQYNVSPQVGLRVIYENFGDFESGSPAMAASAITGGVTLKF